MLWGSVLVNIISKFPILDHKDLENQGPKKLEMQLWPLHFWHVRNYAFLQNQCLKTQWVCVSPFIPHPDLRQESEQREQCFKAWLHTYSGRYSNLSSCQGSLKKVTSPFPRVALSFLKILFIYFWLCWVFVAVQAFSSYGRKLGLPSGWGAQTSHCAGLSCCGACVLDVWASVVAARGFSSCGFLPLAHKAH